jgi:hypothetical protein
MTSHRRFYFHVWDQGRLYRDSEGVELSDLRAAWEELTRVDHELRSEPGGISNVWFEVADSHDRTVLVMPVGFRHGEDVIGHTRA